MGILAEGKKEEYWKNGYVVLDEFYDHEKCDEILSHLVKHTDEEYSPLMNSDRPEFLREYNTMEASAQREVDIRETATYMRNLMKEERAVASLEELYDNREIVGLQTMTLFKHPGTQYANQAWNPHQDNSYPQNPNGMYFTTNLFLADADKENGTMYLYPGSHTQGLFEAEDVKSFREDKGDNPGKTCYIPPELEDKKTDVNFKKGDLLVLNGNCIHGSYANVSDRGRPITMNIYIPKGEYFFPGNTAKRKEIALR